MDRYRYREKRILGPAIWMILLSLLLFWLPLLGPLIAGYVGGRLAGGPGPALMASLLPALVLAAAVFITMSVFALPLLGIILGLGLALHVILNEIGLIAGALIGGLFAS